MKRIFMSILCVASLTSIAYCWQGTWSSSGIPTVQRFQCEAYGDNPQGYDVALIIGLGVPTGGLALILNEKGMQMYDRIMDAKKNGKNVKVAWLTSGSYAIGFKPLKDNGNGLVRTQLVAVEQ